MFIKLKNIFNLLFCSRWRKTQKQSELSPKWPLGWQNTRNENWQIQNLGWRNTRHEIWPQIQNPPWWQNTWKKMPFFEKYKIYQFWLLMLWTSNQMVFCVCLISHVCNLYLYWFVQMFLQIKYMYVEPGLAMMRSPEKCDQSWINWQCNGFDKRWWWWWWLWW